MIAFLVSRGLARPFATLLVYAGVIAALTLAVALYGRHRDARGYARAEAEYAAASLRTQLAAARAADAADTIAAVRETQTRTQIEELRHEAAKGDATPVGPGVSAVLDRLRAQAAR